MFRWGLPLAFLFLVVGVAAAGLALRLDGAAYWVGVGVAAVSFYAAVMSVHYFERSSPDT